MFVALGAFCFAVAAAAANDVVPRLTVHVYGFAGLSPWLLASAEVEAARMLRSVPIELDWRHCTAPGACPPALAATAVSVRILEKALPSATSFALGTVAWSGDEGCAFIFFDRVQALRSHVRLPAHILGRTMAHEIGHLLMPRDRHSGIGLMRAEWTASDLKFNSTTVLGLPAHLIRRIRSGVAGRMQAAER